VGNGGLSLDSLEIPSLPFVEAMAQALSFRVGLRPCLAPLLVGHQCQIDVGVHIGLAFTDCGEKPIRGGTFFNRQVDTAGLPARPRASGGLCGVSLARELAQRLGRYWQAAPSKLLIESIDWTLAGALPRERDDAQDGGDRRHGNSQQQLIQEQTGTEGQQANPDRARETPASCDPAGVSSA